MRSPVRRASLRRMDFEPPISLAAVGVIALVGALVYTVFTVLAIAWG